MNNYEATRYVHKLIADVLANEFTHTSASDYPWSAGKDAPKVRRVLDHWIELHRRRGPLATDRAPRDVEYRGEKLPLEDPPDAPTDVGQNAAAPTADTASTAGHDPAVPAVQAARELSDDHDRRAGDGSPVPLVPPRMEHRNAAGQVIERPNITEAGQHYMVAPPGDREPMRLMFADDIDEALQPLDARAHCGDGDSAIAAFERVREQMAAPIAPPRCDVLRVTAAGVFVCTLPKFHADSMNATPHDWQELDTCSARRLRDDGMWRCIKRNGHVDEHDWRKELP